MKKGSFYMALFFAILGLSGIIQSLTFRYWEAMILPAALSCMIFIAAIVEIVKELVNKPALGKDETKTYFTRDSVRAEARSAFWLIGWISAFMIAIWFFGFLIAVPLYSSSYLKWRKRNWLVAVMFALSADTIIYFVFEVVLRTELYRGLIFGS